MGFFFKNKLQKLEDALEFQERELKRLQDFCKKNPNAKKDNNYRLRSHKEKIEELKRKIKVENL